MIPRAHPPDELLLDYASGAAGEAVALVIATHNTLCPTCRDRVAALEELGGALFDAQPEGGSEDPLPTGLLARLDEPIPAPPPRPTSAETDFLPEPLRSYVPAVIPWKRIAPGLFSHALPLAHVGIPVYLLRSRPHLDVPMHTHPGLELNLVLAGGYTDPAAGAFRRGDVQFTDETVKHGWTVDPGEDCVSLLLRSGRDIQLTWTGKLFAWVTGA